ncbi:MAG TPA: hypothetical protein VK506_05780 [Conexibacter sp.]|nr:hypothetical protein [Conexibacter sp.]
MRYLVLTLACILAMCVDTSAAALGSHAIASHGSGLFYVVVFGAALGTGAPTLLDWAKRLDPTGKVASIVELLAQSNEILQDMVWREGNLPTGHRTTVRTGLPTVAWRLLNGGVTPSKSTTAQIDEQAGMLEAWSEVDVDLLKLNGNTGAFRLSEARAFIEAMNQEMVQTIFYGNSGLAPEEFTGLAPRFSLSTATNGANVIKAGGSGSDNTSIWLVAWGEDTVSGIFPSGSTAGLQHNDYGEVTIEVTAGVAGQRMRAMQERWQWKAGIALKDWRYVVRICNIDISDLSTGSAADLIDAMEQAQETIPNRLGKPVFYMNRTVKRFLRRQVRTDVSAGGGLTFENVMGRPTAMFGDTPIRIVDQLLNTEATVA